MEIRRKHILFSGLLLLALTVSYSCNGNAEVYIKRAVGRYILVEDVTTPELWDTLKNTQTELILNGNMTFKINSTSKCFNQLHGTWDLEDGGGACNSFIFTLDGGKRYEHCTRCIIVDGRCGVKDGLLNFQTPKEIYEDSLWKANRPAAPAEYDPSMNQ